VLGGIAWREDGRFRWEIGFRGDRLFEGLGGSVDDGGGREIRWERGRGGESETILDRAEPAFDVAEELGAVEGLWGHGAAPAGCVSLH
jgi:hypothetical protein